MDRLNDFNGISVAPKEKCTGSNFEPRNTVYCS